MTHTQNSKRRKNTSPLRPPAFDSLEQRLLLAATLNGTQLVITGGDATSADVIALSKSGANLVVSINLGMDIDPAVVTPFPAAAVTSISIQSGGANDTITISGLFASMPLSIDSGDGTDAISIGGGNLDNIASNITFADITAGDTLLVNDVAATIARNVTLTPTTITGLGTSTITYVPADLTTLTINGGSRGNTYTVNGAGATGSPLITTLNSGTGVDNTFVNATTGRLNINGQNGLDNVRVGNAGSLAAIAGQIFISNVSNRSAIFVDDYAATTAKNWLINQSAIAGLAPAQINYVGNSTRVLEIRTGSGNDVASIFGTAAFGTSIESTAGSEIFNFFNGGAASGLTKPLEISNAAGQSNLFIDSSGDNISRSLTITSTGVTGVAAGAIIFDPTDINTLSLIGGNAGNTYNIVSTLPGRALTIYGGAGSDTAIVRGPFLSKVNFNGGANQSGAGDKLQVVGTGSETAVYTPSSVAAGDGAVSVGGQLILFTGLEPIAVAASNLAAMTLITPNGPDLITIDSPLAGQNRISGTSGGVAFEPLSISSIPSFTLDLARNDAGNRDDSVTVSASGLNATGLTSFNLDAGAGNNSFTIQGGAAKLNNINPAGTANLQVNASGNSLLTLNAGQRLAGLDISGTARVNLLPANSYLHLADLSISPTATLDPSDNDLIIQSTAAGKAALLDTINGLLRTGRNNGAWNGPGLRSSTAAANTTRNTTLAAIVNDRGNGTPVRADLSGQPVDVNTILIKYTYNGDSDLNGLINADDYARIDAGYANRATAKGFYNGDFDYSGTVDADDYFLIDRANSGAAAPLSATAPVATAPLSAATQAPEPDPVVTTSVSRSKARRTHHRRQPAKPALPTLQPEALARWLRI